MLRLLLERLRNEITRLPAVKAFATLAHSRLELGLQDTLDATLVRGGESCSGCVVKQSCTCKDGLSCHSICVMVQFSRMHLHGHVCRWLWVVCFCACASVSASTLSLLPHSPPPAPTLAHILGGAMLLASHMSTHACTHACDTSAQNIVPTTLVIEPAKRWGTISSTLSMCWCITSRVPICLSRTFLYNMYRVCLC